MKPTYAALAVLVVSSACGGADSRERRIVTDRWDTVGVIAPENVNDTTLIVVSHIKHWGGGFAVANTELRHLSRDGDLRWTHLRRGPGPGELRSLIAMHVGPHGRLWAYDYQNVKLVEFDTTGAIHRERSLKHLPATPVEFGWTGGRLVVITQTPTPFMMVLDTATTRLVRSIAWPWATRLTPEHSFRARLLSGDSLLIAALQHGPGFLTFDGERIRLHDYIVDVPWALKASPRLTAARADSATFGAVDIAYEAGEVHMLFGGRPKRAAHPFEPTNLIDVYSVDGTYLRSYRLPSHFDRMSQRVVDGAYTLAKETDDGLPMIIRLEPRVE